MFPVRGSTRVSQMVVQKGFWGPYRFRLPNFRDFGFQGAGFKVFFFLKRLFFQVSSRSSREIPVRKAKAGRFQGSRV